MSTVRAVLPRAARDHPVRDDLIPHTARELEVRDSRLSVPQKRELLRALGQHVPARLAGKKVDQMFLAQPDIHIPGKKEYDAYMVQLRESRGLSRARRQSRASVERKEGNSDVRGADAHARPPHSRDAHAHVSRFVSRSRSHSRSRSRSRSRSPLPRDRSPQPHRSRSPPSTRSRPIQANSNSNDTVQHVREDMKVAISSLENRLTEFMSALSSRQEEENRLQSELAAVNMGTPSPGTLIQNEQTDIDHSSVKDTSLLSKQHRALKGKMFIDLSWFSKSNAGVDVHGSGLKAKLNPITSPIEWVVSFRAASDRLAAFHANDKQLPLSLSKYFDLICMLFITYTAASVIMLDTVHRTHLSNTGNDEFHIVDTHLMLTTLVKQGDRDIQRVHASAQSHFSSNPSLSTRPKREAPQGCPPDTCWASFAGKICTNKKCKYKGHVGTIVAASAKTERR